MDGWVTSSDGGALIHHKIYLGPLSQLVKLLKILDRTGSGTTPSPMCRTFPSP